MSELKVIDVNVGVFESNNQIAEEVRKRNRQQRTFMVNVMASPGAEKTTLLLRTIEMLKSKYKIGVMEADIDAVVDAEKMEKAGVESIQIHTGGECAMDAAMTKAALDEFCSNQYELLFLENVGNLVCTAEQDVGASVNVEILSIAEGDDKPLKYPLMFEVCQCILINKIDAKDYFDFDNEKVKERILARNPEAEIIFVSAKTGEGFDKWCDWLCRKVKEWQS